MQRLCLPYGVWGGKTEKRDKEEEEEEEGAVWLTQGRNDTTGTAHINGPRRVKATAVSRGRFSQNQSSDEE